MFNVPCVCHVWKWGGNIRHETLPPPFSASSSVPPISSMGIRSHVRGVHAARSTFKPSRAGRTSIRANRAAFVSGAAAAFVAAACAAIIMLVY